MKTSLCQMASGAALGVLTFFGSLFAADYTTQGWAHKQNVVLNTGMLEGANVDGNVTNFPVLFRLNEGNFDFTQASTSGADMRFTNASFTNLPYEIERWDATNKVAEIWVTVDQINAQDEEQYIIMYWGASTAVSASSSASVFDTLKGFAGVWHLNEDPSGTAPQIKDATTHANNGTTGGTMTSAQLVSGAIGTGLSLDSIDDNIVVPNSASLNFDSSSFCVSLWINSTDTYGQVIRAIDSVCVPESLFGEFIGMNCTYTYDTIVIGLRESANLVAKDPWKLTMFSDKKWGRFTFPEDGAGWCNDDKTPEQCIINNGEWHLLTAVVNRTTDTVKLYRDGELNTPAWGPTHSIYTSIEDLIIGKEGLDYFFGKMDEIRIENGIRNPDWIKLCYENQKPAQTLVKLPLRPGVGISDKHNLSNVNALAAHAGQLTIALYDMRGKQVLIKEISSVKTVGSVANLLKTNNINVSGIYVVRISAIDKKNNTTKVVFNQKCMMIQ